MAMGIRLDKNRPPPFIKIFLLDLLVVFLSPNFHRLRKCLFKTFFLFFEHDMFPFKMLKVNSESEFISDGLHFFTSFNKSFLFFPISDSL